MIRIRQILGQFIGSIDKRKIQQWAAIGHTSEDNIQIMLGHFVEAVAEELTVSDMIDGVNYMAVLEKKFVDYINVASMHTYSSQGKYQQNSAESILYKQRGNAAVLAQYRDDTQNINPYQDENTAVSYDTNEKYVWRPEDAFYTKTMIGLNVKPLHETVPFGYPENEKRLLSLSHRPDGPKYYEKWLYSRPYERDISETIRSSEREGWTGGYDMSSLTKKMNETAVLRYAATTDSNPANFRPKYRTK